MEKENRPATVYDLVRHGIKIAGRYETDGGFEYPVFSVADIATVTGLTPQQSSNLLSLCVDSVLERVGGPKSGNYRVIEHDFDSHFWQMIGQSGEKNSPTKPKPAGTNRSGGGFIESTKPGRSKKVPRRRSQGDTHNH